MFILQQLQHIYDQAKSRQARRINIAIGELVLLSDEEFRNAWTGLIRGSHIENAELNVRRIPAQYQCMACFEKYHPSQGETVCPNCGGVGAKILAGEEFFLEAVEE